MKLEALPIGGVFHFWSGLFEISDNLFRTLRLFLM